MRAIATVTAVLSLLMMASATAQMRWHRGERFMGPRDEPPPSMIIMRGPRGDLPAGEMMRGQREDPPQGTQNRGPRIETAPVAQARAPRGEQASAPAALTQLNMDAVPRLTPDGVRKVQQSLKDKGFNPGPIDGVVGPLTTDAVREFQGRYGIKARGEIDNQTLFALGTVDLAGEAN
jgi:hypothetical protein